PVPGAPDIAIEVISPTERATESHDKIRAYLRNGVSEAWQVFPKSRTVEIYRGNGGISLDASQTISSPLLPGFGVPVASFFV
ncbi:MAG TPA: Uma2 family endonuclease, partial [Bryobacteraceae bacterium]|nr:Uma2 family endonuclease [Bryobacteraceae bacterium]